MSMAIHKLIFVVSKSEKVRNQHLFVPLYDQVNSKTINLRQQLDHRAEQLSVPQVTIN